MSRASEDNTGKRAQLRPQSMAFMHAAPDLVTAGPDSADARDIVEDDPAMRVLSLGVIGGYTA